MEPAENKTSESDRRLTPRVSVMFMGVLDNGAGTASARLTNLSETGGAVAASNVPPAGFWLEFRRGEVALRARVAWLRDGQAGLEFNQAVDPKTLFRTISKPRAKPSYPIRRSPLDPNHLTRVERAEFKRCAQLLGLQPS
jgi:hypothetical protein